jgi:hypothetical protein
LQIPKTVWTSSHLADVLTFIFAVVSWGVSHLDRVGYLKAEDANLFMMLLFVSFNIVRNSKMKGTFFILFSK